MTAASRGVSTDSSPPPWAEVLSAAIAQRPSGSTASTAARSASGDDPETVSTVLAPTCASAFAVRCCAASTQLSTAKTARPTATATRTTS